MKEVNKCNKPKLLYVVTEDWYFVSHRLHLAVAAQKAGFSVAVATRVGKHADIILREGIRLIPLEVSRRSGNPLREFMTLVLLYRRERPDIVHHVALKLVLYGSLAARVARVPAQVNAVTGLGWLFITRNWLIRCIRPAISWMLARLLNTPSCRLIVQNPDDIALLNKAGISKSLLRMVRGAGVNTAMFSPSSKPKSLEPVCVALAARILWDKGVGEFVDAARQLKQTGVNACFVLVGNPDTDNPASVPKDTLQAWQNENIVEWWGHREDMSTVFSAVDVVCLPSYREGLPKVLLEAASCGLPIVSTDVPGCREVVNAGENGLLVPAHDAKALSKALLCLIENPELRVKMGKRSREIALAEFSSEYINGQVLDIYRELTE